MDYRSTFNLSILVTLIHFVFGDLDGCFTYDERLICRGQTVQEIPDGIPVQLAYVSLEQTNISVLPSSAFSNVTNLETFAVTSSELRSIESGVFDRFNSTLSVIKITGNYYLEMIPTGVFSKLNNLTVLDLRDNSLTTLEGVLGGLTNLHYLNVNNNSLSAARADTLEDLHSIKHVDMSNNKLWYTNFSVLESLETLKLYNNAIFSVDYTFKGLSNLTQLDLHSNRIRDVDKGAFGDLINLEVIDLSENNIEWFFPGTFSASKSLTQFTASSNPLRLMDDALPVDLKILVLNLTHCNFESVPRLPESLRFLDLSFNRIKTVNARDTERFSLLNAFTLEENALELVESGSFEKMTSLQRLVLANNRLKHIPGPLPRSISYLHMENNSIESIDPNAFKPGTRLEILSLRKNEIKTINSTVFDNLHSVVQLHLDNNPLSELSGQGFLDILGVEQLFLNRLTLSRIEEQWFEGLGTLHVLEMSFVRINYEDIHGNFFRHLLSLNTLKLNGSPYLAQFFLNHSDVNFYGMAELSLMDNGLTLLPASITRIMMVAKQVWLRGNDFHCVDSMLQMPLFHLMEPTMFRDFSTLKCGSPPELKGRHLSKLDDGLHNETDVTTSAADSYEGYDHEDYYPYEYFPDMDMLTGLLDENMSQHLPPFQTDENYQETTVQLSYRTTATTQNATPNSTASSSDLQSVTPTSTPSGRTLQANPKTTGKPRDTSSESSLTLKHAGIAIGTSLGVILIMLLIALVIFKCFGGRRPNNTLQQNGGTEVPSNDYVFIVSATDKPEPKVHRKLTRSERGSTTSRASEDITNTTDVSMKVYTMDVDA